MTRYLILWFCTWMLVAGDVQSQQIHAGKTGDELIGILRQEFSPAQTLSYRDARHEMFSSVDNVGGEVRLFYTGQSIRTSGIPDHTFVNTEHLWPQSRFGSGQSSGKKSDLYHLRPVFNRVNSFRGNNRFGEIADDDTEKWWKDQNFEREIPTGNLDEYSEGTSSRFEPREDAKGDVARSLFYFVTVYGQSGIEMEFFESQKNILLEWHRIDPVNATERSRNNSIEAIQGNRIPMWMM